MGQSNRLGPGMSRRKTTVRSLRVGEKFSFIPKAWYGDAVLTKKRHRTKTDIQGFGTGLIFVKTDLYDLVFDAAVVNPPGRIYGVLGHEEVWCYDKGE